MVNNRGYVTHGFTLVELVVTILLLAILSVVALPRLMGAGSYSAYALRQEFISELRRVQLLAITNPDRCYRINIDNGGYQLSHLQQDCSTLIANETQHAFPRNTRIQLLANSRDTFSVQFDSDGRSVFLPAGLGCNGNCLQVMADDTLGIAIEAEGYIHEGG
ncbi:type IV pilin protein [Shewanella sp. YIC-542]|uniref:type IV pilin protein n=1 Tax=Shewanella mytili TaxID=3377111 RepID=UPI00398E9CB7